METLPRTLVALGVLLLGAGLMLHFGSFPQWLGRLPGDIRVERPGFQLYLPITTSLLISGVFSGIVWLLGRLR